jgi:hypothetical protein
MSRSQRLIALIMVLISLSCCSSEPELTADEACDEYATAYARNLQMCSNGLYFVQYSATGGKSWYMDALKQKCLREVTAPGAGTTAQWWKTCAAAVTQSTCDDWIDGRKPEDCVTPSGQNAVGDPCVFSSQCRSHNCSIVGATLCGTCVADKEVIEAGQACRSGDTCEGGYYCDKVCTAYVGGAGVCDANRLCGGNYTCVGTAGAQRCQAKRIRAGETCGEGLPECSGYAWLGCNPDTSKCELWGARTAGQTCGGQFDYCSSGGLCVDTTSPFLCMAPADDGSACDEVTGPKCKLFSHCIGGVCRARDPQSC